ncbi:helix-turn-helix domain-containing protein [Photobacterium kishitanii]|uniref:XRE family transcriptional regulator n=1 Tax=Photobacterium kishitanii TaxID=318456 RepID=A0AAX0YP51_9GAMM|nr:helix-turn-helix transcriptional regulator [Photobacterium kishitanii]PSX16841.1 XRE family transcriptional regulator [Photobacterium kishitanii]PSX26618.1 XRE family transcriptional regulator [Photobacterium kishitanii]PSX29088.1 XRE family transcriptional regulator [Photobacterium kishitanii]PSX39066.1 XRE family transcriptional regulator [Photobacterium kishitanii]
MGLSDNLKRHRKDKGWTQEHLAHVSGVSVKTISRIESGGNHSLSSLSQLASAFEITVCDLNKAHFPNEVDVNSQLNELRAKDYLSRIKKIYLETGSFGEEYDASGNILKWNAFCNLLQEIKDQDLTSFIADELMDEVKLRVYRQLMNRFIFENHSPYCYRVYRDNELLDVDEVRKALIQYEENKKDINNKNIEKHQRVAIDWNEKKIELDIYCEMLNLYRSFHGTHK